MHAQINDGNTQTIKVKAEDNSSTINTETKNSSGLLDDGNTAVPDLKLEKEKGISMLPTEQFIDNNKQYTKKANKSITEGKVELDQFKRDQPLGDIKTKSKTLKIACRDFANIDGDLISIFLNGKEVKHEMFLEGGFRGIEIEIPVGLNTIDFQAENMGLAPPNTAELVILDDQGETVTSAQWNLYTGYKATIVVVKD